MRVYLPATLHVLAAVAKASPALLAAGPGFAVTAGLREWYASGDTEELEYVAMTLAAEASLALLAADPSAPRRRVVVVAEVEDRSVAADPGAGRATLGRIEVLEAIALTAVDAIHVDGDEAVGAVTAAAANPGDEPAAEDAADHELLWYATQELERLLPDDLS